MKKTLGGDRLGSGKKMQVDLHEFSRSTHDLSYLWRSTMSAGTLVPFMSEVALPGDTFDINLDADIKTHPTVGPLFGSFKVQLDVFEAPLRLYNSYLHNNKLGIGMNMSKIFLPTVVLSAPKVNLSQLDGDDISNSQINPSAIFSYLGIRGVGRVATGILPFRNRSFNAIPWLSYWEIYKNYYANKQEEIGAVIHADWATPRTIDITEFAVHPALDVVTHAPTDVFVEVDGPTMFRLTFDETIGVSYTVNQILDNIIVYQGSGQTLPRMLREFVWSTAVKASDPTKLFIYTKPMGKYTIQSWEWKPIQANYNNPPRVQTFPLADIDKMRDKILAFQDLTGPFESNVVAQTDNILPYDYINWIDIDGTQPINPLMSSQEGLAIKTYQSDLFNNWLSTEWIDGTDGITEVTAIDTSGGSFTIDTLNLSKKVYDMLNRIAVSGGSYDDWLDAVWAHERFMRAESPIYHGGLIRELVFQEVVSNSGMNNDVDSPLGTLAGKGVMSQKRKGGKIVIKVNEPSYIIGIISLTPRVDYSQGNKWDTHLQTMDDLHKPSLDEIGFQELITEQMAWFDTEWDDGTSTWVTKSAGKQPAWVNYMTNVNQTRGNFAFESNEMFMTLNRRYEWDASQPTEGIQDLTTYIDPVKFNFIFADTALDAQNYWAQIAVDITARRIMSAKVMPNL